MIKIVGISFVVLLCTIALKKYNFTYAVLLSICGAIILFFSISDKISELIDELKNISSSITGVTSYVALMLKVLSIILIGEFASEICRDNGENAISSVIETGTKIIIITMVMPLFTSILSIVTGLLE